MDIIPGTPEITACAPLDDERLVPPAEDMTKTLVPVVQPDGVRAQQPAHALDQLGVGRFHDQVKMVAHQAAGVDLPAGPLAGLGQGLEEVLSIDVVDKNVLLAVTPAHDVVNGAGILDSHFPWHRLIGAYRPGSTQAKSTDVMV